MHICEAWAHRSPENLLEKHHQCEKRNSLRDMKMGLFVHCHTQLSFLPPPSLPLLLRWPQPACPQDPFYLSAKTGADDWKSAPRMKVSVSMCFLFGMLHLPARAQVWEGHSRYFWSGLGRLIKPPPPPTPAQLFQVIPQLNYIPQWLCCCSHIYTSDWNLVEMKMQSSYPVSPGGQVILSSWSVHVDWTVAYFGRVATKLFKWNEEENKLLKYT